MTFRQLAKLSLEVEATSGREIKPAWVWGSRSSAGRSRCLYYGRINTN